MSDAGSASKAREPDRTDQSGIRSWAAGIVNHGSYEDLARCLDALSRQVLPARAIAVYDTGLDPERFEGLRVAHPQVDFELGPNRGYAGGSNRVLAHLLAQPHPPSFCLIMNPDVMLDPDHSARLVSAMVERDDVAVAGGKLLRPDRRTIDSAAIRFPRHGRPRDRGSEQVDLGQFDASESVDAVSGAAMMIRVGAVVDLRIDDEFFDEDFFAYHEDTDLCWRARRLGWEILYEPEAVAVHARGWQRKARNLIAISTRRHSFKNHYLQLVKNQTRTGFIADLPWLLSWEILRFGFVLLKDRAMFGAYADAWRALPEARRKRALIRSKAERTDRNRNS